MLVKVPIHLKCMYPPPPFLLLLHLRDSEQQRKAKQLLGSSNVGEMPYYPSLTPENPTDINPKR